MTSSIKSDIRFELLVPVSVYGRNFGLIKTTLKNGPTGNPSLPVNRSEIQKIKSTKARGIKFSICQFMVSWGFQIRESRKSLVSPRKNHHIDALSAIQLSICVLIRISFSNLRTSIFQLRSLSQFWQKIFFTIVQSKS
jgi:hypothetical protein